MVNATLRYLTEHKGGLEKRQAESWLPLIHLHYSAGDREIHGRV